MREILSAANPFKLSAGDHVHRAFAWMDATSLGRFVKERSQSFVAINSSIADIGYVLYAFTAGERISTLLLCGMACKISGSTLLLADDKKGALASHDNRWPSKLVLFLHHTAKAVVVPVRGTMPRRLKAVLPNPFTVALSLYALNGLTYFINGCEEIVHHATLLDCSQTAAGITMTLGGFSFAASGLEKNKGFRENLWSRRAQYFYAVTPVFCIINLAASIASGHSARALALALVTSMAIFQIYVRHNFKRQRVV